MAGRCLRLGRRNLEVLLTSLMLPVILMLLFVYLFGGALDTGGRYVSYVVPGVLVLCAGFGSASTAVGVSQDMHGGIIDRFRSMDVSGAAVLCRPRGGQPGAQRRVDGPGLRGRVPHRIPVGRRSGRAGWPPAGSCCCSS